MAFLIYFFVLLVSAASVLFGLDLMSSPLPKTPNVPIGRSVQVASQPPVQEPHKKAADEQALTPVYPTTPGAPKVQAETSGAAPQQDAKLAPAPAAPTAAAPAVTPPAPATPVPAAPVAQNPAPAAVAQNPVPAAVAQNPAPAAAAAPPSAPVAPTQPAATIAQNSQPAVVAPAQEPAREQQAKVEPAPQPQAKVEPATAAQPVQIEAKQPVETEAKEPVQTEAKVEPVTATQPAKHASANSCNVQACSAAYQSFRASDCTYQPHGSERRLCSMTGGTVTARAAKPDRPEKKRSEQTARHSRAPDDVGDDDAERVVKRQPLDLHPASSRSATTSSRGEMREVERIVRHMTRGEGADIPVQDADGRVFIVPRGYR